MSIATRLKLAAAFSVAVVVIVGTLLVSATQQLKQAVRENEAAEAIFNGVTSIRYLTLEYVLRHEARTLAQWRLRYASLSKLIQDTSHFNAGEEQDHIEAIRVAHESVGDLFGKLVETHRERLADAVPGRVLEDLEARLAGQIMNRIQAKISDSLSLAERSRAGILDAQARTTFVASASGFAVVLTIAAILALVFRSVMAPLERLRQGTAVVGGGNLGFRLGMQAKDEIGTLARAFDEMTGKLEKTTVSRNELARSNEELESQVALRSQAERKALEQLQRLNLLHQVTSAIGERQDMKSIFEVVVRSVEDNLPADFSCICTRESDEDWLTLAHVGAGSKEGAREMGLLESARIEIGENGLSACLGGKLVYEPELAVVETGLARRLLQAGMHSLVLSPLQVESQVFGVLVAARRKPQAFASGECEFLRQLSGHVALAAHQAHLHSALQRAYDDLRQTQQAVLQQERLRALGQMASGIAHDINNAISPVALYTESLLETEPDLSARAREYLETIKRAIEDVAKTVSRMREFYRGREVQLVLAPVSLNMLAQQVVDLTRARWADMAQERGSVVHVSVELAPELPDIMGAESEIREALINLIFNAVDAMPDGGDLTVATRASADCLDLPGANEPRHVMLEIGDTGTGMDEETRRRCLEPFFTTKGERGTGLGLAMVYGVVQRHSAEIEIDSEPGKGTVVRLVFTVAETVAAGTGAPPRKVPMPSRQRILVVDDDPLLLKSLRDTLEQDGHVVVAANGGQAGIDAFDAAHARGEHFGAVITDLGMPHVDGRAVARKIKRVSSATPVILLTGWGQRLIEEGEVPPNVDRVLSKPPKLRELREALEALCPESST